MRLWMCGLLLLGVALVSGCADGDALMPRSGGRAYEVLVVGDADSLVARALKAPMDGLPQTEPLFDVSTVARLDQVSRVARSIVVVEVDSVRHPKVTLRYERNVHAAPQLLVRVNTPSAQALRAFLAKDAHLLTQLLVEQEMAVEADALKKKRNAKGEEAIAKMFDVQMLVPPDMTAMKCGRNFMWLSADDGAGSRNVCVYVLPLKDGFTSLEERFTALRDSVMRQNLPGEAQGMCVQTVSGSLSWQEATVEGQPRRIVRGLWEMRGDAMGGPFVAHVIQKGDALLVAEAFIYAPGQKKRNKLRQLEAALFTLTLTGNQQTKGAE